MSRQTALDNLCLRPTARWGHVEYSLNYHGAYLERKVGLPQSAPDFWQRVHERFAFDFIWSTNDGMVDWGAKGRVTDMGHAAYAADGSDQTNPKACPFQTMEEVWAFDAVEEYGLPDFDAQVKAYEDQIRHMRNAFPEQLTTGGYYRTIVSGALASFGWDMLLMAASDPGKMEKVFDSFFRRTLFHMNAWAKTSVEAIMQHDDFVWTGGAFMHPDIYRRIIIPRYAELWKPLRAAGKKVIFCSDGNFEEFAEDIVAAGADALCFEPCNDFGRMAEKFGKTTCLLGSSVDCRELTLGHWDAVQRQIDATFEALASCRGAILAVGNHVPPNIPEDMMDRYFDALLPRLKR